MRCVICSETSLDLFDSFYDLKRVTSDCKPFCSGGKLSLCKNCGTIQKAVDNKWLEEIAAIYKNYEVYSQSDGEEQAVFNQQTGKPSKRSAVLNSFIRDSKLLTPNNGKVLDYGCANGEFLSIFTDYWPSWKLYGSDLSDKYEAQLNSIPNFTTLYKESDIPTKEFDLISLIHTLEHLVTPTETLIQLRKSLNKNGLLFIQVPNVQETPFDILVADHLTHFTTQTLSALLHRTGFKVKSISTNTVSKEISVLATPEFNTDPLNTAPAQNEISDAANTIGNHFRFLTQMLSDAEALEKQGEFAIFGSSISATWLSNYFKNAICFVDEDPNRIGKSHQNKPICALSQIPKDTPIYIPLAFPIAKGIVSRPSNRDRNFILPPKIKGAVCI